MPKFTEHDVDGGFEGFINRAMESLAALLTEVGSNEVQQIMQDISVPVEITEDGNVIRSKPGEPPRMETGQLINSVDFAVVRDGTTVTLTVGAGPVIGEDGDYAVILENELNRPYIQPSFERAQAAVESLLQQD